MSLFLWILQVLLAVHTLMGAFWKFSNTPAEAIPSLSAIPNFLWLGMSFIEILVSLCLIAPAFQKFMKNKNLGKLVPFAALYIVFEMLVFTFVHTMSPETNNSPVVYWMIVAVICGFLAYGRAVLKPLKI